VSRDKKCLFFLEIDALFALFEANLFQENHELIPSLSNFVDKIVGN
jgi:hypothetical protein